MPLASVKGADKDTEATQELHHVSNVVVRKVANLQVSQNRSLGGVFAALGLEA
jgi:hypothetical protein